MLSSLSVVRSVGARTLFLSTAIITATILFWTSEGGDPGGYLTPIFSFLFFSLDEHGAMCELLILVIASLLAARAHGRALLGWIGAHPLIVASVSFVVMCGGSLLVYRNHPLSMDEYAAFFQSQIFAAGQLHGHFPAALLDWLIPKPFQNYFLAVSRPSGAVISSYWPSFALLLTPFTWLHIPWACNPAISAVTLVGLHRLTLTVLGDRDAAGLAVLLTVASPVFFANGISYYSMPAHLLASTLYAVLLVEPTPRRALLAGVVGSVALTLHNPVPHLLFAAAWIVWLATRPGRVRLLSCLLAGYLPLCLILGLGWSCLSRGLIDQGILVAPTTGSSLLAFLRQIPAIFTTPAPDILLARLIALAKIWLWAMPGLLVLAAAGAWKWRQHSACRCLLGAALVTFLGYLFVPLDQGHGWGYRYFHSAWLALPILAAGALTRPPASIESRELSRMNVWACMFEDGQTRTFTVTCALLTLVMGVGFRAVQMHDFIASDLQQVPAYAGTERRVVLLDPRFSFYGQDLVQNDPWLRGDVIRMISHGPTADAAMMREHFPGMHRVYRDPFGAVWSMAPPRTQPGSASSTPRPDCRSLGTPQSMRVRCVTLDSRSDPT